MKYDPPVSGIDLKQNGTKPWIEVTFKNGITWRPRLWEVGAIISGIGKAEDMKYPNGKGHKLTREFFDECWGKTRDEIYDLSLSEKYDPNRVMTERYSPYKCTFCGRPSTTEGECEYCRAANMAFNEVK
jgi:hypothetical protein